MTQEKSKREYNEGKWMEKGIPEDLPRPVHRSVHGWTGHVI